MDLNIDIGNVYSIPVNAGLIMDIFVLAIVFIIVMVAILILIIGVRRR